VAIDSSSIIASDGKTTLKILISRVGIAGYAAALFLHRHAHALSVIDKASALRSMVEREYGNHFSLEAPLLRGIMGAGTPH
jgi:hypothetical protein